jgi:hypothetical protein
VSMAAGLNDGIEAARPAPLIEIGRNAGALANRANRNVAIKDEPCFRWLSWLRRRVRVGIAPYIGILGRRLSGCDSAPRGTIWKSFARRVLKPIA